MLPLPLDSKSPARHAALVVLSAGATLLGGLLAEATTPPERSRVEPVVVVIDRTCPPPSAEVATAPKTQRFTVRTATHRQPAIVSISGGHEHVLRLEYLPAGDPLRKLGFASGMAVHTVGLSSANEIIEKVYAPLLGLARNPEEDAPCSLSCSSHLRRVGRQTR